MRLPGKAGGAPVWLPIDAKFPKEEYERLMDAQEAADAEGARAAGAALGKAVEAQARLIAASTPPHTTDFAIMFLPTESLYAEVLRRPGLLDRLHGLRVNVAGPSNLAALLNSLQMGFRTLAIEQRSSEVWQVLRAVKTEFGSSARRWPASEDAGQRQQQDRPDRSAHARHAAQPEERRSLARGRRAAGAGRAGIGRCRRIQCVRQSG